MCQNRNVLSYDLMKPGRGQKHPTREVAGSRIELLHSINTLHRDAVKLSNPGGQALMWWA